MDDARSAGMPGAEADAADRPGGSGVLALAVERRLAALPAPAADLLTPGWHVLAMERSPRYDAVVVVDHGSDVAEARRAKAALAEAVQRLPGVERAVGTPRGVMLRLTAAAVVADVAAGISADRMRYGETARADAGPVNVTFSTPNTNKALHVGHLRANYVGVALARLFASQGHRVTTTDLLSDYGIHVCQAIVGYLRWGGGVTPAVAGAKGDQFVGHFYARFHGAPPNEWDRGGEAVSPEELEAQAVDLLRRLDLGDDEVLRLNHRVTTWSLHGIRETYTRIGTRFDAAFFESDTLPLAREAIARGLETGACARRPDGSVFVDLTDVGLGVVTLLRGDGTPLVHTQLLGVWIRRSLLQAGVHQIHLVGGQWQAGIAALLELARRVGHADAADRTEQVNFGMISSPEGPIRSRKGHGFGADGMLDRIRDEIAGRWSATATTPIGRRTLETCDQLANAAIKLLLLRVPRAKDLVFDEDELLEAALRDLARLLRVVARAERDGPGEVPPPADEAARSLAHHLDGFPRAVSSALDRRDPSVVVRHLLRVCDGVDACRRTGLDPALARAAGVVVRRGLELLNVDVPAYLAELGGALTGPVRSEPAAVAVPV